MSSEIVQVRQSPFCDFSDFPTLLTPSFYQLVLVFYICTPLQGDLLQLSLAQL